MPARPKRLVQRSFSEVESGGGNNGHLNDSFSLFIPHCLGSSKPLMNAFQRDPHLLYFSFLFKFNH
jgi:hypothetical protein